MNPTPPFILAPTDSPDGGFLGHLDEKQRAALESLKADLARGGQPARGGRAPAGSPSADADGAATATEGDTQADVAPLEVGARQRPSEGGKRG